MCESLQYGSVETSVVGQQKIITQKIIQVEENDRGNDMKNKEKLKDSVLIKIILIAAIVIIAFVLRSVLENKHEEIKIDKQTAGKTVREMNYAKPVQEDDSILQVFKEKYSSAEILLACREDVTDDGLDDLVVICKLEEGNRTIVVTDSGDSLNYNFSDPIPAPIENQKIQFKNIDKEGEIEFIITGEKKGAVGYAIYRMIDGQPVDLFGEGMEDCC